MSKIKKIIVITGDGSQSYTIGDWTFDSKIAEIKWTGQRFPDHTEYEYSVLDENGKLVSEIVNCPHILEYE